MNQNFNYFRFKISLLSKFMKLKMQNITHCVETAEDIVKWAQYN